MAKDRDGNYVTVEVGYDALGGTAKVVKVHINESKGGAVEKFKVLVGQSDILD